MSREGGRLLSSPRAVGLAGLVLALPTLAVGFFSDDWFMLAALRRRWPEAPSFWDLYDFTPDSEAGVVRQIARGILPWWTAPSLRVHLVRPLSSLLLALDERVFGDAAVLWHVHSLLWWAALLAVMAALYRRVLPGPVGTLALLVFAVAPAHATAYGWLSSRHMLVAAATCLGGLLAHLRARQEGWRPGRWLGPLGLAVGLAGSEAALGGAALWLSYEALGPPALGTGRQRALGAAPALAVVAIYLVLYRLAGGVMQSSGAYVSPLQDPAAFAALAVVRFPMLLGNVLLEVPVELSLGHPSWPFVAAGAAGVALCARLAWAARDWISTAERAALGWLLPGAAAAVLGTTGGLPGGRALMVANVGFAALLAVLVRRGLERGPVERGTRLLAGLLAVLHLALAPLMALAGDVVASGMARRTSAIAHELPEAVRPARRVFSLAASDPMVNLYVMATLLAEGGDGVDCFARLTAAPADYRVTRTGPASLSVEPIGRPLLLGPFEALYRARSVPVHAGEEVAVCGARVRVADATDGLPTRLEIGFDVPLETPELATVAWDGESLAPVHLAPGETRVLPWRRGPMGNQ